MLPDGPEVEQAMLGPAGVLEGARKGATVVDMSSISPLVAQKVAAACAAKGVERETLWNGKDPRIQS
jgi:2-hydroxy-3-oxopropionate reductase